jgi:hypothetical protein
MAAKTVNSGKINFLDYTDLRKVEVYLSSTLPTSQIYNGNTDEYTPDWTETNLELSADVFLDSKEITAEKIQWFTKINSVKEQIADANGNSLVIKDNILKSHGIITFICEATYQGILGHAEITFTRVDTGIDGTSGKDGTSITILGTYESLEALKAAHPIGNAGDSYIVQGNLWVWAIDDAAWENVGNIQGAPGKDGQDAKAIFLNANTQVFKVSKSGAISPTEIKVSAQPVNTTITSYSYSTDGGQTFLSAADGVSRSGNQITITGSKMTSNSITIMATGEQYQDTFTVYKVFDGSDGKTGNDGAPAPIAFLTNESIGFAANSKGEISATSAVTNVVAFVGTTSVKPTIGTLSGVPEGMTITQTAVGNEILLTLTIANNSTLGSAKSNGGRITIPVTIPSTPTITTNLQLGWNKVNAGRSVSSIAARYAVSNSNTTAPTSWNITIPTRGEGQYLWMADYITYDDGTNATVGARVVTGDTGSPGVSIVSVESYFSNNQNNTSAPAATATWTKSPTRQVGYYTWRKDLITYSDNSSGYTTPVCITGDKGDKGIDGVTYYTWIKYADTPTTGMSDSPDGKMYMGIAYNKTTSIESTNYSDYTWALIKGSNGVNGINGQTYYTWVKYADDASGTNMSDDPFNKSYIGLAYNKTSTVESTVASDYQWSLFRGADGIPGEDAVTFQVYSTDGYVLSNSTPRITLRTFAYVGDTQITGDIVYQWYQVKDGVSTAISGANGSSYDVYHSDVSFINTYMCIMTFKGVNYSGVVTIDDKNDVNTVFSSKPKSYSAGDIWVVGADYIPAGVEIGTVLKAEHPNNTYSDSDWVAATKYDDHIKALEDKVKQYNQYFSFDSQNGLKISARDSNGNLSQFSTTLSNDRLSFNQGNEAVAYIESNKLKIKEAEIVSPLTVTGVYSGSTMQQAPIINIGKFSIVVESNGSLSIVANT